MGWGLTWTALAWTAWGQEGPTIERVTIGIAGLYKVGHWTPVQVTVSGGATQLTGRLRLTVADGNGLGSVYEHPACQVPARGQTDLSDLRPVWTARQWIDHRVPGR